MKLPPEWPGEVKGIVAFVLILALTYLLKRPGEPVVTFVLRTLDGVGGAMEELEE